MLRVHVNAAVVIAQKLMESGTLGTERMNQEKEKQKGAQVIFIQYQLVIGKNIWHFRSVKSTNLL